MFKSQPHGPSSASSSFFSYFHAATPPFSSSATARLRSLSIRFFPLHVRLLQASTSVTFIIYLRLCRSPSALQRVARCTGSPILSCDNLIGQKLRHCDVIYFEKFVEEQDAAGEGGKRPIKTLMFIEGSPTRLGCTVLLRMLPDYHHHVKSYENTLITKFFGLHRIKPSSGQNSKVSHNFQIEIDSKFLEAQRIMDYSLLLGVHYRAPQHLRPLMSYNRSTDGDGLAILAEEDPLEDEVMNYPQGLVLFPRGGDDNSVVVGPHMRGSRLRASSAGDEEVDLLLPGTARQDIAKPVKNCQKLTFIIMLITISSLPYKSNDCPRKNICLGRWKGSFGCGAVVENASLAMQSEY
ncbi:hypothetical protein RIF29_29631 [Crotalaria pallida]|uniref:PIPK domain-containing protein n=1 Tax=Crotalaria pallida TaxID=3830 RepID=A0AAN9HU31_CROPI